MISFVDAEVFSIALFGLLRGRPLVLGMDPLTIVSTPSVTAGVARSSLLRLLL